jgi:hypothetical protein
MSILDINLETNIVDFSQHDRNGRIYDPDSVKYPDSRTLPIVAAPNDQLPEVGKPNTIYAVKDTLYMYDANGEWLEIVGLHTNGKWRNIPSMIQKLKEKMNSNEKRIANLILKLDELKGL